MKMQSGSISVGDFRNQLEKFQVPDWQRAEVWKRPRSQFLIDSVLRGWNLPKFYFYQDQQDPDIQWIVDGQQRLAAIRMFFLGEIALKPETVQHFELDTKPTATYYNDLPPHLRAQFDNFTLQYDLIFEADPAELKEFFMRLQQGVVLTGAEKLNAVNSAFRDYAFALTKHDFFKTRLAFPDKRSAHLALAMRVIACEVTGWQSGIRFREMIKIAEKHAEFDSASPIAQKIESGLNFLLDIFPEQSEVLGGSPATQAYMSFVIDVHARGNAQGHQTIIRQFIEDFDAEFGKAEENRGHARNAEEQDYVDFSGALWSSTQDVFGVRQRALLSRFRAHDPEVFEAIYGAEMAKASITVRRREIIHSNSPVLGFSSLLRQALVQEHIASSGHLEAHLSQNAQVTRLYPNNAQRETAMTVMTSLFNAELSPLNEYGNFRVEAMFLIGLFRISSDEIEKNIPALTNNFIYTTAVRQYARELAGLMRRTGINTLNGLIAMKSGFEVSPEEKVELLKTLHDPEKLQDPNNQLIIRLKGVLERDKVVPEATPHPVRAGQMLGLL